MLQNMRLVDEEQVISKVTEDLTHVEDMLDDCLSSLANYTGEETCMSTVKSLI